MAKLISLSVLFVVGTLSMQSLQGQDGQLGEVSTDQSKTVFASSRTFIGILGNLQGADFKCQQMADAAGLEGRFKAWLSNAGFNPANRFKRANVPYVLTNGAIIALDWDDLSNCPSNAPNCLRSAIDHDENGDFILFNDPQARAWTSTLRDGTPLIGAEEMSCLEWTSTLEVVSGVPQRRFGGFGELTSTSATWTEAGALPCDIPLRLICFEQ